MTRDEAVALIKLRLGSRTDLDTQIVSEMQLAQVELEQGTEFPWFLRTAVSLTNDPVELDEVALPADYLGLGRNDVVRWWDGSVWRRLFRKDYGDTLDAALERYVVPYFWDIVGFKLMLTPVPEAQGSVWLPYFKAADVLSTGASTNAWLTYAPEVLVSATGLKAATHLRDPEAQQSFAATLKLAMDSLHRATLNREIEGEDLKMAFGQEVD